MTAVIKVPVLCACSWAGEAAMRARCPGCGADHHARLNTDRLAILRAIAAWEPGTKATPLNPIQRRWFLRYQLIVVVDPPLEAREHPAHRKPVRRHELTEAGREVLAADGARRLEEQRRHIVAESVARHSR